MEGHFAVGDGPSRLQDLPRNCAGFPVLISSQTWNWEDMVLFYAKPLQWSLTCKMAQPVSEEQRTAKPIEQDSPFNHIASFEAHSPITLMLTHYHQHLKYGTGNCCHMTGLSMVAEVGHPLKISLGHWVHGWKMLHGWSLEVPKLIAGNFCEEANNIIFKLWWANSWQRGRRCLLASLPCRLEWELNWIEKAGKFGLVEPSPKRSSALFAVSTLQKEKTFLANSHGRKVLIQ